MAERHKEAVYRQLLRLCGNYDDAEDALMEALVAAFRASKQLRDDQAFRAWLTSIARRACFRLKHKESFRRLVDENELDAVPSNEDEAERAVFRSCVHDAVQSLSPTYREVYESCELRDMDARELSRKLGISLSAVKSGCFGQGPRFVRRWMRAYAAR